MNLTKHTLTNKRIFIIDNNLANCAIMQMLLEREGATTSIERRGKDILRKLSFFGHVDLFLLDPMFSHASKEQSVFDQIRTVDIYSNTPIVAVSSTDPAIGIPQCQAQGFAGFVTKPTTYDLFVRQIAAILQGKAVWYFSDLEHHKWSYEVANNV